MKGMPTKDGFFLKRQPGHPNMCVELWTKGKTYRVMEGYLITGREREFDDAEFIPIPPPPEDGGDYAAVWVKKQRDERGNRMCAGCQLRPCSAMISMPHPSGVALYYEPGPDCPLGSD